MSALHTRRNPSSAATSLERGDRWEDIAACRDVDVTELADPFHLRDGERVGPDTWEAAESICAGCPVIAQCAAETAILDRQHGAVGYRAGMAPGARSRKSWQRPS